MESLGNMYDLFFKSSLYSMERGRCGRGGRGAGGLCCSARTGAWWMNGTWFEGGQGGEPADIWFMSFRRRVTDGRVGRHKSGG